MSAKELQRNQAVYSARIETNKISQDSLLRAGGLYMGQDRERALLQLMQRSHLENLARARARLLGWVRWGARRQNLTGVDLMEPLLLDAQSNLPSARYVFANAGNLSFSDLSFDAVTQLTLFSSRFDRILIIWSHMAAWGVAGPAGNSISEHATFVRPCDWAGSHCLFGDLFSWSTLESA